LGLTLRARLWNIVVGFAERAASTAACEPRINTAGVEGMATCQTSNVVKILKDIQTDSACVSRLGH
jgi:hypothetical protein